MDDVVDARPEPNEAPSADPAVELLKLATERFKQTYEAHQADFDACDDVQQFIAGHQWPQGIQRDREAHDRPCLTLDHLNQYVRHVVNQGLMQSRDVRVLAMSGEADDKVGEILAGMIRQITQTSTSKVAYETGLRHACQVGFGYWRVKVQPILKTATPENPDGLMEITIRKIKDPRMVLMDPFCEYPDGRDAHYCFVLSKLTRTEFKQQYPEAAEAGVQSWKSLDTSETLPHIGEGSLVVAEYYYRAPDGTMKWAVLCPDTVLQEGVHHGDVMPIIRAVGEEFEVEGKERKRGMINESSMDAQRAYNYSASACIEGAALAPLAPFIATEGQVEQYLTEWKDAHRVPRAVLRYTPVSLAGQPVPPPQRSEAAGISAGWQGMMANLINDTQMIMGLAQPSVMGTGGAPVQSGAGINAQQEPGEINTFHFHEHWHLAIEQTGRVILAMIPHVYTQAQAVKITGDDGAMSTAMLNPQLQQTMLEEQDAYGKVLSTSYNPSIGRYDVAISTGPSSASKKMEANKLLMTVVNANPDIMKIAGDLIIGSFDMAGADVLAKRLKAQLPPGTTEEVTGQLAMLQQAQEQNQQLQQQLADMEKILMGEREQNQAKLMKAQMDNATDLQQATIENHAGLLKQRLDDQGAVQLATIKSQTDLETTTQNNIVKVLVAKIQAKSKIDVETMKRFNEAAHDPTHTGRMAGYLGVMDDLSAPEEPPMLPLQTAPAEPMPAAAPMAPAGPRNRWKIHRDADGNIAHIAPVHSGGGWRVSRDADGNLDQLVPDDALALS